MRRLHSLLAAAALVASALATSPVAMAQETLDVGVLKNSDISVVQKLLYPKTDALELAVAVGLMPFDTYTTTPVASFGVVKHFSETLGVEGSLTGGYSLKNVAYKQLESPAYGIQPDAYRFLGSALVDVQWSPIYAKLNWMGKKVVHHDIYGLAGIGAAVEQAMMPDASIAVAPGLGLGVGMRFFLASGDAIRVQIRDDLLYQKRVKTAEVQPWFVKQNVALSVGYSKMKRSK